MEYIFTLNITIKHYFEKLCYQTLQQNKFY